jgi:hypothetical protein
METWPDTTWVNVAGTLPVAVSLATKPRSFMKRSAAMWVPDPAVE